MSEPNHTFLFEIKDSGGLDGAIPAYEDKVSVSLFRGGGVNPEDFCKFMQGALSDYFEFACVERVKTRKNRKVKP